MSFVYRRMAPDARVFVAGHRGLVGSAVVRALASRGYGDVVVRGRDTLDLRDSTAVRAFFEAERPEFVVLAAAKVGGIHANHTRRGEFIRENLQIQDAVIGAAFDTGVQRLLFLGSSCIYPRDCAQPIRESSLLTGPLEPTNEPYAIAKIAGLKLCESLNHQYGTRYLSVMPTNLYGPNDLFDPQNSHVLPALLLRFTEAVETGAPEIRIWGTGTPRREFLHVDDLADACVWLLEQTDTTELLNIGTGEDLPISELAREIAALTGYRGEIVFDPTRPDGTPRKQLDVSRLHALGWRHRIALADGLRDTWQWYLANRDRARTHG